MAGARPAQSDLEVEEGAALVWYGYGYALSDWE